LHKCIANYLNKAIRFRNAPDCANIGACFSLQKRPFAQPASQTDYFRTPEILEEILWVCRTFPHISGISTLARLANAARRR
jgi:hypothetical protein